MTRSDTQQRSHKAYRHALHALAKRHPEEFAAVLREERVALGLPAQAVPHHKGPAKREVDVDEARALYEKGMSVREVAEELGLAKSTVYRRLQPEVTMRPAARVQGKQ